MFETFTDFVCKCQYQNDKNDDKTTKTKINIYTNKMQGKHRSKTRTHEIEKLAVGI